MFCIACGASNSEHARFCLRCGTAMYAPKPHDTQPDAEPEPPALEPRAPEHQDVRSSQAPPATFSPAHAPASGPVEPQSVSPRVPSTSEAPPVDQAEATGVLAPTSSEITYFIRTLEGTQGPHRVSDLSYWKNSGSLSSSTACRAVGSDVWSTVGEVLARSEGRPSSQDRIVGGTRGKSRGVLFALALLGVALVEVFRSVRGLSSKSVDAYNLGYLIGSSAAIPVAIFVVVGILVAIASKLTRRPWSSLDRVAAAAAVVLYALSLLWLPAKAPRSASSAGAATRLVGGDTTLANETRAQADPPKGASVNSPGEGEGGGSTQRLRSLGPSYLRVRVPHGVSVELPRNWKALSDNTRVTLDALVSAKTSEQAASVDATSDLSFAANLYDDHNKTIALANFRFYPEQTVTQDDVAEASEDDLAGFDKSLEATTRKGYVGFGGRVTEWRGTRRVRHFDRLLLISEYSRSEIDGGGAFRVRLVRALNGSKSFTFTISYAEQAERILRPICDSVISSLRF